MLSAFILVEDARRADPSVDHVRPIVKTLGALVGLVVSDIVADATIVTRPDAALAGLEGSAGCTVVEGHDLGEALVRALPRARRDDALILRPGYAPDGTFRAEIELALSGRTTPALALLAEPANLMQRLFPRIAPVGGLIASRAALLSAAPGGRGRVATLQRALNARPMRARAVRV